MTEAQIVIRSGRDVIWRISEAREKVIFHARRDPRYLLLGRLDYAELVAEMRRGFRYATTSDPLEATEILGMIPIVDPTTDRRVTPILESQSLMITIRPEAFV